MLEKIRKLLASPRMPWIAALVAAVLMLPSIGSGLIMDDIAHRASFLPEFSAPGGSMGDWDMFRFQGPDRGYLRLNLDRGLWPWWIAPEYRLAFFRPLSSLWHAFDYKIWPNSPWIMHVECIAIYSAMVLAAGLLYRRHVNPAWAAGLAALFFAADDAHSMVVMWIANRNAVLAGAFGIAAIVAHDHARRGSRGGAFLAPLLFALGLLSGEAAVAAAGYLVSYAAFLDDAPVASRIRSLLPYAGVGLAWLGLYKILGYGAYGGGFYIDPGSEPLVFGKALIERIPVLLLAQLGLPPAEVWASLPREMLGPAMAAIVVLLAALGYLFYRAVKSDRAARFFAAGMLLALVPVCATLPNDRLLLFSGVGAFGLIAIFIARAGEAAGRAERAISKTVAVVFVIIHGIIGPVLLPVRSATLASGFKGYLDRAERSIPGDAELKGKTLVVMSAPDVLVTSFVMADRTYQKRAHPKALRLLSIVERGTAEVSRVDASTLAITQSEGFFHEFWSLIFRGPRVPYRVGDTVTMAGMRVEIAEVLPDGRPRRVLFHFDEPLDSAAFCWVRWEGMGFVPSPPPALGQTTQLEPIDFVKAIFGPE